MNDVIEQLFARKSVRAFTDEPVTAEERRLILEAACQAPTAGNQQLYTIIDVTDQAEKEQLAELCDHQPFIANAPLVLVFCADCDKWLRAYGFAGVEEPRRPGVGDLLLAVSDTNIAAQNAVVAAWSLGVGSCYIGDVMEQCDAMRELLGLPQWVFPACMAVFGHPTQQQAARVKPSRMPLDAVVCENRYRPWDEQTARTALTERAGIKGFDAWVQAFCARKYESDFSREMTRSVAEYLEQYRS